MLQAARRAAKPRASTSSSASSRPTAAPRPRRCSTGLEVLPRRTVEYSGRTLEEMDLDAILARRPPLALVDELAHTNAPGSRHPKRYQDVEELLAAGIDVYTTLNIQHLESLNDVVARITARPRARDGAGPRPRRGRRDRARRPPARRADRAPAARARSTSREQAERALDHFFSPGNLTALRELALRRTAERVDEQMLQLHARARHRRALGRRRAGAGLRRARLPAPPGSCAPPSARRRAARAVDGAPCRDRRAAAPVARPNATASPRPCGWPSGSAPRP